MNLSFNKNEHTWIQEVCCDTRIHEETLEISLADHLPDMEKIIQVDGVAFLRSKESDQGKVTLTGQAEVNVLYLPEGSNLVTTMEAAVPFGLSITNSAFDPETMVISQMNIVKAGAKLIGSRKLILKVEVCVETACYNKRNMELCVDLEEKETSGALILKESKEVSVISGVTEKVFVVNDEYAMTSGKPAIDEILQRSLSLHAGDCKCVGSKLIFKGTAKTTVLYRNRTDGSIGNTEFQSVFSQVIELENTLENAEYTVKLIPNGLYLSCDEESGNISAEIHIVAQCLSIQTEEIHFIADIYSPKYEMEASWRELPACQTDDPLTLTDVFREQLRTSYPIRSILTACVRTGRTETQEGENTFEVKVNLELSVTYFDENNILRYDCGKGEISFRTDAAAACDYRISSIQIEDIYPAILGEGVEIRFQAVLVLFKSKAILCRPLGEAAYDENKCRDLSDVPSIMLYRYHSGDTLWELAKRFSSSDDLILQANPMAEGEAYRDGELLIIPKRR